MGCQVAITPVDTRVCVDAGGRHVISFWRLQRTRAITKILNHRYQKMEDILEDRRRTGDWWWVAREFRTPVYRHRKTRSPNAIKGDVSRSVPVRYAIDQIVSESGRGRKEVELEAVQILDQMGHEMSMKTIRIFGILLSKSWKRIYRGVFVNPEGVEAVRKLVPNYPVILLPTHRSYMDFLIISYAFFYYNLPLPIIASGQDFMGMKIMGSMMRHAGAFFIRRSFGKDKLYWALFSEYVKTHVVNGEAPLEFFIEGTRSRSAKSLPPKFGLLSAALEPFFKAEVPDIVIVPVSISYDRTLEEVLYAYEMLGVPKPKESTRGLLKARKILGDDYGNFFMTVGKPISIKDYCGSDVNRTVHNLGPKHLSPVSPAEQQIVEKLAVDVIKCQQKNLVLSPFVLIAAVLVNHLQNNVTEVVLRHLVEDVRWLLSLLQNFGTPVNWPGDATPEEVVQDSCKVHHNLVKITEIGTVYIEQIHSRSSTSGTLSDLSEQTLDKAVSHMLLTHYSNQLLHWIVPEGLIAMALMSAPDIVVDKDWLFSEYQFLEKLLQFEFIFVKGETQHDFDKALSFMNMAEACTVEGNEVSAITDSKLFKFLLQMFEPFVGAYNVVCQTLICPGKVALPAAPKAIAKKAQEEAEKLLQAEKFSQNTILSMESLTNAVNALWAMGALRKESRIEGSPLFQAVHAELVTAAKRLEPYAGWLSSIQSEHVSDILLSARAKL